MLTLDSTLSASSRSVRDRLQRRLRGSVWLPDDAGYAAATAAWNLNARHRPALVVEAQDAADVVAAVQGAVEAGLGVGVLATGHGTGRACDGGVLINTALLREAHIDPTARRARVAAGTVWDDVIAPAAAHGLAGLPGSSTRVGVVGYTLGGGFGWLGRRYGFAAHSVTRAEVVTGEGDLVTASPEEHPELFWGLQGGAGNLGVVTELEFALHPVRTVYAGNLYYPLSRAADVCGFVADWSRPGSSAVPPELTAAVTFRFFPPLPTVPEPLRGQSLVALRGCFCGDPAAGAALIDQARAALGPALVDSFTTMPAAALASVSMDPVDPLPSLNHTELVRELTADAITALVELAGPDSGSPLVMLELRTLGAALAGPDDALSPIAHSDAAFSLNAIGITPDAERTAAVRTHLDKVRTRMAPFATGHTYVNFLDLDGATPERVRAAYSDRDWRRLVELKSRYDPRNLFRFNRNIPTPQEVSTP